LFYRRVT